MITRTKHSAWVEVGCIQLLFQTLSCLELNELYTMTQTRLYSGLQIGQYFQTQTKADAKKIQISQMTYDT